MIPLLINGDLSLDNRNNGSEVTIGSNTNTYGPDMFFGFNRGYSGFFSLQRRTDLTLSGAQYYLRIKTTTADASPSSAAEYTVCTRIKGWDCLQLQQGMSGAKDLTVSFWARSSLTGNFGFSLESYSSDAYAVNFSIPTANMWTYVYFTIPGNTGGSWNYMDGIGLKLIWDIGSGSDFQGSSGWTTATEKNHLSGNIKLVSTLNATLDLALVKIQPGTTATEFDYLPMDLMIQRATPYITNPL